MVAYAAIQSIRTHHIQTFMQEKMRAFKTGQKAVIIKGRKKKEENFVDCRQA